MKEELQKALMNEFPSLYKPGMEFRCDDGWYQLISSMSRELVDDNKASHLTTVKEKFGALRVYYDWPTSDAIVDKYEALSRHTCETCGSTDDARIVTMNMWMKCMCGECVLKSHLEQL